MKHYGDITKINGADVPIVDIVCGGSPCQDLSVAGKRAGLDGQRSGLFMDQIRIIKEMRNESARQLSMRGTAYTWRDIRPRYMVWENVPGAFSSNKGEDFRAVLEETAKIVEKDAGIPEPPGGKWPYAGCIVGDGWSIAWRVHDAQYWGVPQRRRRICMLADFSGDSAGKILFELQRETVDPDRKQTIMDIREKSESKIQSVGKGVSGNTEESGKTGKAAAGDIGTGIEETSRCLNSWDIQSKHVQPENGVAESLYAGECRGGGGESYVLQNALSIQEQSVCSINGDVAGTLDASYYKGCGERQGVERDVVCYGISSYDSNSMKSDNPHSGVYEAETSRTLDLNGGSPACNQGGMAVVCLEGNGSRDSHKGDGYKVSETMYTLNTVEQHAVFDARGNGKGDLSPTITGDHENRITDYTAVCVEPSAWDGGQVSPTLTANNANGAQRMPDKDNFNAVISFTTEQTPKTDENNKAFSLRSRDYKDPQSIAYGLDRAAYNYGENAKFNFAVDKEKVGTCVAKGPNAVFQSIVRRLTPLECERLQGFPDGWTDIGDWIDSKGKTHKGDSDSPRYKASGNSIALPFWIWLAERIRMQYLDYVPTMASLFDGIGGFPFVFSKVCIDPVWASEIEEFPIQVTKKHFPYTV